MKRNTGAGEVWQVYGLGGELLAEYAAGASPSQPRKEYGYRGGELLVVAEVPSAGWGAAPSFTDEHLAGKVVQALYVTELRQAIDSLRAHKGRAAYGWRAAAGSGDPITAESFLELRRALDEALGEPAGGYTPGLEPRKPIRAVFLEELRERVLGAWQTGSSGADVRWLVADQLGTPRMVIARTGTLAGVTRHDYFPFGEEIQAGTGGRTTSQGYSRFDGVRLRFTSKERDDETGLDYFLARYYSSTQGRFTSVDPGNAGAYEADPQSWNGYSYARNNSLLYTDPDGEKYLICGPDGRNCYEHNDDDFYDARRTGRKEGYQFTGNGDFFEHGQICDKDGNVIATYVQISIDDPTRQFIFEMRRRTAPIPKAVAAFFGISLVGGATGGAMYYALGPTATVTTLGLGGAKATTIAAQRLRRLAGLTRTEAREALKKEGFNSRGPSRAGNETWTHPDGSRVTIKSNGEVVRNPNAEAVRSRGLGEGRKGWEIDPETGNVVRPHSVPREKVQ